MTIFRNLIYSIFFTIIAFMITIIYTSLSLGKDLPLPAWTVLFSFYSVEVQSIRPFDKIDRYLSCNPSANTLRSTREHAAEIDCIAVMQRVRDVVPLFISSYSRKSIRDVVLPRIKRFAKFFQIGGP